MKIIKQAQSKWIKSLKNGIGTIALGSGSYQGSYTYNSRFYEEGGTNPEELLAAAHASCFTMELVSVLEKNLFVPEFLETHAYVYMEKLNNQIGISKIELVTRVKDEFIGEAEFIKLAEIAKNCIISRALSVKIELKALVIKQEEPWRL